MRIISGRLRRRKLLANPGLVTRPITDRVKGSLFTLLADELVDAKVADIFAGTGTLGLEALSRGAASVVFYERDRSACDLLFKNVTNLGVNDEVFCWPTDVTRTSFRPRDQEFMLPYDVIFFDPPYKLLKDIQPGHMLYRSLLRLSKPEVSSEDALMLFRTPREAEFNMPACWKLERTSSYSTMDIHWYRNNASQAEPDLNADEDLVAETDASIDVDLDSTCEDEPAFDSDAESQAASDSPEGD